MITSTMKITYFRGDLKTQKYIELDFVFNTMKSVEHSKPVHTLRETVPCSRNMDISLYTDKIPYLVFSSLFKKAGNEQVMIAYNGCLLLEINDLQSKKEQSEVRRIASEIPQTLAVFTGSSGLSIKILTLFTLPDGKLPSRRKEAELFHAHAYRKAVHYYQAHLPYKIELHPPLLEHGCRLSFDPSLFYNPAAIPVRMEQPLQMPEEITYRESVQAEDDPILRLMPGLERSRIISRLYDSCLLQAIETTNRSNEKGDIKPFLIKLSENCFHSGIPEEDALRWTMVHSPVSAHEEEVRSTIHTVYQFAKRFGETPCLPTGQSLAIKTDEFMKRRYEFRRNTLTGEVEYRARGSFYFDFAPVTDQVLNSISLNAQAEGIEIWDRDVKRYVYSDRVHAFYPLDDYLDHLPEWDGKDHIRMLADTLPTHCEAWRDLFYTWFLSMIGHWKQMDCSHANSVLPLLVGPQGCGKSTWCLNLLPPVLRNYYTDSIDFSNKRDAEYLLTRFALVNIDEFDSVNANNQSFLKHILQKPVVNIRQLYKRSVHALRRYASFIATCNNFDLLTDPTGSRRFICIEITGTIKNNIPIAYDQLYAQALAALRKGERYWFNPEEEAFIMQNNITFQQLPVEEQLFLRYFRAATDEDENGEYLPAIEILQYLQKVSGMKFGNKRLTYFGRLLQKNKIPFKRTKRGTCYFVTKNEVFDI